MKFMLHNSSCIFWVKDVWGEVGLLEFIIALSKSLYNFWSETLGLDNNKHFNNLIVEIVEKNKTIGYLFAF